MIVAAATAGISMNVEFANKFKLTGGRQIRLFFQFASRRGKGRLPDIAI